MRNTLRMRSGVGVLAFTLGCIPVVLAGRAQQKQYPYPPVRDQRGVIPPGPRLLPSPPLGDGPFTFQTTEQNIRVVVVTIRVVAPVEPRVSA